MIGSVLSLILVVALILSDGNTLLLISYFTVMGVILLGVCLNKVQSHTHHKNSN